MKSIKKISLIAFVTLAISSSLSSFAAVPMPKGWYIEGNVGAARVSNTSYGTGTSFGNSGTGWNLNGGFKFIPYLGAEVGYTRYANSNVNAQGVQVAKIQPRYSYQGALKGILPVSDSGFELFAKLGLARVSSHMKIQNSAVASTIPNLATGTSLHTGAYYAAGADYNFTPNVAVNLQWAQAQGSSSSGNMSLYSLGISYILS